MRYTVTPYIFHTNIYAYGDAQWARQFKYVHSLCSIDSSTCALIKCATDVLLQLVAGSFSDVRMYMSGLVALSCVERCSTMRFLAGSAQ